MQSTIDSVDLQMLSAYGFNKLPAIVRTELLASGRVASTIRKCTTSPSKRKVLYGVGINDAEYKVAVRISGVLVTCPAYRAWCSMLSRCYSQVYQASKPTYVGCTVDVAWLSFTVFREWWLLNYRDGFHLDKDILVPNNKVYSAATCLYVPQWLNSFITATTKRGLYPVGVDLDKTNKVRPYRAQCNDFGTRVYLGSYTTPEEAHGAWLLYKLKLAVAKWDELESIRVGLADSVLAKLRAIC